MYVGFEVHDECVVDLFCKYFGVSKGVICAICMGAYNFFIQATSIIRLKDYDICVLVNFIMLVESYSNTKF